jgi:predicted dehydrogenase
MRVVQVGAGKMGQTWLKALAGSGDVDLVGIVEPVEAGRTRAMQEYGLLPEQCFASIEDALAGLEWDAAVVVTPPPSHRPLAGQLLCAGKHVLLEKPLATTIEDARALVEIAAKTGKTLMVAQNYRYFEAFATVRSLVERGRIGTVRSVNIQFHKDTRTLFGEGDFRYGMEHVLLVDMSIHHFDMIRAALGTNAARVYAQTWHVPGGNYQHDAAASVLMTMENGVAVSYTGNWAGFGPETSWNGHWEIVGDLGRIVWSGGDWSEADVSLHLWGENPEPVDLVQLENGGQAGLIEAFVCGVETGTPPETAAADNIASLAIVFAAVESSESGRVVDLATLDSQDAAAG